MSSGKGREGKEGMGREVGHGMGRWEGLKRHNPHTITIRRSRSRKESNANGAGKLGCGLAGAGWLAGIWVVLVGFFGFKWIV